MTWFHRSFRARVGLAAGLLTAAAGGTPAGVAAPLPAGVSLTRVDPGAALAAARAGRVELTLDGRRFVALVHPAPWRQPTARVAIGDNGATVTSPSSSAAFLGQVAGAPGSRVLLTVTSVGVDGYVRLADRSFDFEPLFFTNHEASPSTTRVRATLGSSAPHAPLQAGQPVQAESIGNPLLLEWGDSNFYSRYGSSGWGPKMDAVANRMNSDYSGNLGWYFTRQTLVTCTTSSCDSTYGSTSTSAVNLLDGWAHAMNTEHSAGRKSFDSAFLYSGKYLGGTNGISYDPGRYSLGEFTPDGPYDNSDYSGSQVMAHEIGHAFSAGHDNSYYEETYSAFVCEVPVLPVLGCLKGHYETRSYSPRRYHYSIMCGSCFNTPPSSYWDSSFTSTSRSQINGCHNGSWSGGGYAPPALGGSTMNMGSNCPERF